MIDTQLIGLFTQFSDLELLKILSRGLWNDRLAMVVIAMLAALTTMAVVVLLALVLLVVLLIIATVVGIAVALRAIERALALWLGRCLMFCRCFRFRSTCFRFCLRCGRSRLFGKRILARTTTLALRRIARFFGSFCCICCRFFCVRFTRTTSLYLRFFFGHSF